ncbi:GNAT family N-acetyltransferase [Solirubrum puertoriconensis]|uniref:GCN5 family acetyltransferase n=1 Tax=Solirubrum puertoriconensis TaxID=1751427 RepID=A0A9X0HJP8_SOLP1|nr:N-acetyltransferase [Solirubrum puertoriconensis]KUG07205.1 GCN5 family acetyltransferase [Solirubrum puertoriconensis]
MAEPNPQIRPEMPADKEAVFEVNKHAFNRPDEALLVDALRQSPAFVPGLSLVAEAAGQVVGHILFTIIKIEQPGREPITSLALAPMAVLPEWQGEGLGTQLVQRGLEQARALGYRSVIVLGHERYYPRFGFRPAQEWGLSAPFAVPAAAFMALELVTGGLAGVQGVVRYAPEFGL